MRAYLRNEIESASPARILELLLNGALRFMADAERDYQEGRTAEARDAASRAADIVTELSATLRSDVAPELASALLPIYDFVIRRLLQSVLNDDVIALAEAKQTFETIAEAFLIALDKALAEASASSSAASPSP
jgi:flagellar biosynthetic protein FliS